MSKRSAAFVPSPELQKPSSKKTRKAEASATPPGNRQSTRSTAKGMKGVESSENYEEGETQILEPEGGTAAAAGEIVHEPAADDERTDAAYKAAMARMHEVVSEKMNFSVMIVSLEKKKKKLEAKITDLKAALKAEVVIVIELKGKVEEMGARLVVECDQVSKQAEGMAASVRKDAEEGVELAEEAEGMVVASVCEDAEK